MLLNGTPLYIGTSGYNHEDWKGNFAPQEIHNYDLLTYYADQGFNFLELAFTFYRMPEEDKIRHILLRTGDRLKFSVRMPKALIKNPDDESALKEFIKGISPMVESGTLACLYADYHHSMSASKKNQELIVRLRSKFPYITFFAELHNRTWYKGRTFDYFKENGVGLSVLDMPSVQGIAPYYPVNLNNALYFKLYGRSPLWLTASEKYVNYNYSDAEMKKFLTDAADRSVTAKAIFMVFANVADGIAPKNAQRMAELLK